MVQLSSNKKIYKLLWIMLTLLLVFRYGQGTDYINYSFHYQSIGQMGVLRGISYYGLDIGYMVINKFFNMCGVSFQWFVGIISLFMMLCLNRYIEQYSKKPVLTLLLFYPTYFMTYYSSAISQGIVLALFIGVMLELLQKKKIVLYVLLCFVASTIHFSGVILFLGLLIHINNEKVYRYLIILSFAMSGIGIVLGLRVSYVSAYYGSPRLISIAEKVIWLLVLIYLSRRVEMSEKDTNCLKLYFTGFCIAMVFLWFPTVSSRLCVYYKVLETGLFANLIYKFTGEAQYGEAKRKIFKYTLVGILIAALTTTMFCKNINQYLNNGAYKDTSFFAYKYISVFEKEKLYDYRDSIFKGLVD